MSGFLPDIASWALGGGANNSNNNTTNAEGTTATSNNNNDDNINNLPPVPMTPQELRDQRLARMALLQNQQQSTTAENNNNNSEDPVPMDIVPSSPSSDPASASRQQQQQQSSKTNNIHRSNTNNMPPNKTSNQKVKGPSPPTILTSAAAAAASSDTTNATTTTKRSTATTTLLQRKQESLLAKCLQVQLVGGTLHNNNSSALESTTVLDTGSVEISVTTIAEILALRLSLEPNTNKILAVAYLGAAYNRTTDELRTLTNSNISNSTNASKRVSSNSTSATHEALTELLMEIQKQTVSYAATCLLEPDVFPSMSIDVEIQWATALLKATSGSTAPEHNLTMGGTQSFYYLVMEELCQQQQQSNGVGAEEECSRQTVRRMVQYYMKTLLFQSESVLDSISVDGLSTASTAAANAGVGVIGPTVVVTALTAMAMHKSAALAMAELDSFLLPPAGTPEAVAQIRPPPASISNPLLQHFLGDTSQHRAYTARSGPGLEKSTLLGMVLRVGAPRTTENPAFPRHSILRQSLVSVESATRTQRQQLTSHQQACFQLVMALLKGGGTVARARLFTWFTDALLVNIGASGLRPDPAKVSSSDLLLNMQVMLLKLCDPFTGDHSKQHLIDAGFVSTPAAHGGVFCTTGEDAVPRLGSTDASVSIATYQPKNAFIPQCFFFCARSLHLSVVPLLQQHENLLRHISHWHYELSNSGRDLQSDPRFAALISRQRSEEVALFQEEMMEATLNFCNFTAKVLIDMNDETIASMPEEFVSDMCDVLLSMATLKPKLLAGHEFRFVFQLVVKFLSPKYASVRAGGFVDYNNLCFFR